MLDQKPTKPEPRYTLQEAARAIGVTSRELFVALRRRRVLDANNVPHPRWKNAGYFVEHEGTFKHPVVGTRPYSRTHVTPTGMRWLREIATSDGLTGELQAGERTRKLLREIARMNPDAGEIGPGKLRHLVEEARAVVGTQAVSS